MNKIVCLFVCLFASSVNASIITFDAQPEVYFVTPIVEGDYVFTSDYDGFGTNNNSLWPSNGTTHLMSWTNSGSSSGFSLTNSTGSIFDVLSFDFAGGYVIGGSPVSSLIVTGFLSGVVVNSTLFTDGSDFFNGSSYSTLNLLSFSGIDLLQVEAIGTVNRANYDNFVLNAGELSVPEPTSLALLGLGLAGIGFSRKKKTS